MKAKSIGKLTRVDMQECLTQADTFLEWLVQDDVLQMLGEMIEKELVRSEESSSLIAIDRNAAVVNVRQTGGKVMIYSQWEEASYEALGRLLTFTASIQPILVVWISSRFSHEHLQVFDWLNRMVSQTVEWIPVQFELWRIDDSAPAPKFNVVSSQGDRGCPSARVAERMHNAVSHPFRESTDETRDRREFSGEAASAGKPITGSGTSQPVSVRENFVYTKTYT